MAKCNNCGKATTFGHNRSFSQRATNRTCLLYTSYVISAEGKKILPKMKKEWAGIVSVMDKMLA